MKFYVVYGHNEWHPDILLIWFVNRFSIFCLYSELLDSKLYWKWHFCISGMCVWSVALGWISVLNMSLSHIISYFAYWWLTASYVNMCTCVFQFLFHHVMCLFIHPCIISISLPIRLASACLSVHLSVCSRARWVNVLPAISPEIQAPRSMEIQTSHSHCASSHPLTELKSSTGIGPADGQKVGD